jgi:SpoVK/Ycf46/Vps4 family AAA+-type ATPase
MQTTTQKSNSSAQERLKAAERELSSFADRIDETLRKHHANRALQKLLEPRKNDKEKNEPSKGPSGITYILGILVFVILAGVLKTFKFIPASDWIALIGGVIFAWKFETKIAPMIFFAGCKFRLMRLEGKSNDEAHPDALLVAPVPGNSMQFDIENWASIRNAAPGHLFISIQNRSAEGIAAISLRNEGKLAVTSWVRDLYLDNALEPLHQDVKSLALEFDEACDRYLTVAPKIENSRALKSNKNQRPQKTPEEAWKEVSIESTVQARLMSLAQHFAEASMSASRGLLLYGPPGTGKTLIAKTLAESMGCAFFPLSLSDLKAGFIGQSGEKVNELWQRALAEERAVIFVDECEGVFGRRGSVNTDSFSEEIVQTFLSKWDGFSKQCSVWVVGATNRRDLIDPAILSRFGEEVEIGLPNEKQRLAILSSELTKRGVSTSLPPDTAGLTQGLAGRELETIAGRIARESASKELTSEVLKEYTLAFRKQGSTLTDSSATWDTLVLAESVLRDLKSSAQLMKNADAAIKRGLNVPKGLLLYGPPGTGKTQIARTLANETDLKFIAASTADLKAGFVGQSGQKVKELFERAREAAPSVLFLDELDIVAPARGGGGSDFTQEIVGQLLQEMDGAKSQTQTVFVLAATNRLDQLDSAVLSRFPKKIEIPNPDNNARAQLLKVMLKSKPIDFDIDITCVSLASQSEGMSGRDLRNWIEQAEQVAVGRALDGEGLHTATIRLEDFSKT